MSQSSGNGQERVGSVGRPEQQKRELAAHNDGHADRRNASRPDVVQAGCRRLLPHHAARIQQSGINEETARARGYWSATSQAEVLRLGFSRSQCGAPGLIAPIRSLDGDVVLYQNRPDQPRVLRDGPAKYETPKGCRLRIDVPPPVRAKVTDQTVPLFIVLGIRQADAAVTRGLCCLALLQPHGWKRQDDFWNRVPLEKRQVYIVCDSEVASTPPSALAFEELFTFLKGRRAEPKFIVLPPSKDGRKLALDDYLVEGHPVDDLVALASDVIPGREQPAEVGCDGTTYEATDDGIFALVPGKDGVDRVQLTNFAARIVAEVEFADDDRTTREFEVEARVTGETKLVVVKADVFDQMDWVRPELGANAIVYDRTPRRHATLLAMQSLSHPIPAFKGVRSLGWHEVNGKWGRVHAGGIISADSPAAADVDLANRSDATPDSDKELRCHGPKSPISPKRNTVFPLRASIPSVLSGYCLPAPSEGRALQEDVKKSFSLLDLGPHCITVPMYAGVWRAALCEVDNSFCVNGTTGQAKTEFITLFLQHFGPGLSARKLIASWRSTPNYITAVLAMARHVIVPVDDLVLEGSRGDINRIYRNAAEILRGQGNAAGRGRCNPDGTPRKPQPPGGLLVSTGEVRLPGHSLNARLLNLDFDGGVLFDPKSKEKADRLSQYQAYASEGAFARTASAFFHWLAPQYDAKMRDFHEQALQFRSELFLARSEHARTATILAELLAALDIFFGFMLDVKVIDWEGFERLWELAHDGLYACQDQQARDQAEEDPAKRYLSLLVAALGTGHAHLAYLVEVEEPGDELGDPRLWGYETKIVHVPKAKARKGSGNNKAQREEADGASDDDDADIEYEERPIRVKRGKQIGWKLYDNVYLEPRASLEVVNALAEGCGEHPIPLSEKALGKRLAEQGFLASARDDGNTARLPVDGIKRGVFHIMTWKLVDFHRSDEDWAAVRDEEALLSHERYIKEQRERDAVRRRARQRAHDFMQKSFAELLRPF